jgi:hypothetical protein
VTAPAIGACTIVTNTARYRVTDDTTITDTASKTVSVCNYNAGLTIGYWANHLANSAKTGSWIDSACSKGLPNGTSCSSNGPWTKQFLGGSICTSPNACTVGELSDAHATAPITSGYVVNSITKAAAVFNANNCSNASTSDSNAAACLAAQLLGAELNVGNIANPCVCSTIHNAIVFLTNVGYKGPGQSVTFNGIYTRAYAITLKTALDNYNNNRGCPSP